MMNNKTLTANQNPPDFKERKHLKAVGINAANLIIVIVIPLCSV